MSVVPGSSPVIGSRRMPFTVKLAPQLVNRLATRQVSFSTSQCEISGLLYGVGESGNIFIQAFRPFPEGGKLVTGLGNRSEQNQILQQNVSAAANDAETAKLKVLGWYALRQEGGLSGSDLTYHNWFFTLPDEAALVIRPDGASEVMLELFCRATNGVLSDEARRVGLARLSGTSVDQPVEIVLGANIQDDFFMRAYEGEEEETEPEVSTWKTGFLEQSRKILMQLRPGKASRKELPTPAANANGFALTPVSHSADPSLTNRAEERSLPVPLPTVPQPSPSLVPVAASLPTIRERPLWIAATLVFLAASAASFGVIYYFRGIQAGGSWPNFLHNSAPASALGLRLEAQGDRLLLSWNRQDTLVRHASNGFLEITDGTLRRQVVLDSAQVANGSILYHPASDDISFQLEVRGQDGRREAESMRVLEAAKPPALDLSPEKPMLHEPVIDLPRPESIRPLPKSPATPKEQPIPQKKKSDIAEPPEGSQPLPSRDTTKPSLESPTGPAKNAAPEEEFHAVPEDAPEPRDAATPVPAVKNEAAPSMQNLPLPTQNSPLPTPVPRQSTNLSSYQAPRPLRQVLPNISMLAPGTLAAAGQIEVIVKINAAGRITNAQVMTHGRTLSSPLVASALAAARQWQFAPAILNGKPVESEHSILFQFSKGR